MVAVDNTGYIRKSKTLKVKTKERTYLYNKGAISELAGDYIVAGYVGSGSRSFNKYDSYMRLAVNELNAAYSIRSTNQIDFSDYGKLYLDVNISRGSTEYAVNHVFLSTISNYNGVDNTTGDIGTFGYSRTSGKQLLIGDISNVNKSGYLYIRQTHTGYIDINRIWIEK